MIQSTPYRVNTKYEKLANDAFQIVRKAIMEELREANEYSELGIEITKANIERYYYLINYLIYIRQVIDNWLESSGNTCLSEKDYQKVLDAYLINCIIKDGICDKYTNNLINLILKVPKCVEPFTYVWTGLGICSPTGGENLVERVNLSKYQSGVYIETLEIPTEVSLEAFKFYVPEGTQELLDARFISSSPNDNCCFEIIPVSPIVILDEVRNNDFTATWDGGTVYNIILTRISDNAELVNEFTTDTVRTFTNLDISTSYQLSVILTNCAGTSTSFLVVTTLPYYVNINICPSLSSQLTLTNAVEGSNIVEIYGDTFRFRFDDLTEPYFTVNSVTVNSVDYLNSVIFDKSISTVDTGGIIEIAGITEDKTVNICGVQGNVCNAISSFYDDSIETITMRVI